MTVFPSGASPDEVLLPGTPAFVTESYVTLAERARTRDFGLLGDDVIILDTETTGLSSQENELIEISAARLVGGTVAERFDTFVHPTGPIPPEIMQLTGITNADVAHAPTAPEAVAALAAFVGGSPVVAHNASFDRAFIERVPGGAEVSELWIDSLALSRVALPRLASHKLATMAELFGCASVSHRACDDVDALAGVWPILLTALTDLPEGLVRAFADMHPDVAWPYRPIFSYLAQEAVADAPFSLMEARARVLEADPAPQHVDVDELPALSVPTREEIERAFAPGGLVAAMYPEYEPRPEQVAMALEVRDALATSSHRVIEAGTGVGKSVGYLVPLALTAKRNNITVGVATKSNNLADQLIFHELPRLARELDDGLSYTALKGYDHYPCLRKLERLRRSTAAIKTNRDPADTLTAIAVIYAYTCQSPEGDLDALGIRWRSVDRSSLTTGSRECARRLCPFFPDKCLVHGARRRAARADVVVTNHSLLFRNVQADGKILPPIRIWAVDEAHGIEAEARRQWAIEVSAEEIRTLFERLGNDKGGALGRVLADVASSDASTLFMGLLAKANASVARASLVTADVFDRARDLARASREYGYDSANVWVSPELRSTNEWTELALAGRVAAEALDEADKNLKAAVEALDAERPEWVVDLADIERRLAEALAGLKLILDGEDEHYVYSVRVNQRVRAGGEVLCAERIDIGEVFAERWYPEMRSLIFTSATLSVSDDFSHFNRAVGLDALEPGASRALHLDSSYDFDRNMTVVVAGDLPDPRNRDAYLRALERLLVDVHRAMGGSVLTLFTNRRDMEELYELVEPTLAREGLELACQTRQASARQLRDHFISEKGSSLFALKAFWEGFDASGETLRCVVIPKLPFARPTDPLSCERDLREKGSWSRYVLPEAVLELKQAAGRLIRSSSDTGVLVLADSRLVSKGYGKKFLNSLPTGGYQRIDAAQVGRYLELWRRSHE